MKKTRKSLSRDDWLRAARKVFVESGIDDVKIDRLAKAMKVTRGSFYWHFKDLEDLQGALLQDWQDRNHQEMDTVRMQWRGRSPSIHDIGAIWLEEGPEFPIFSMAIRVWARKSTMVAAVVRSVDYAWIKLLEQAFRADGRNDMEAHARARVLYFHRIGYWALPMNESVEDRCGLSPFFFEIFAGRKPDDRFFELHEEIIERMLRRNRQAG